MHSKQMRGIEFVYELWLPARTLTRSLDTRTPARLDPSLRCYSVIWISSPLFTRPDKNRPPKTSVTIRNRIKPASHNLLSALRWYIKNETTVKIKATTANKRFIAFTSDCRKRIKPTGITGHANHRNSANHLARIPVSFSKCLSWNALIVTRFKLERQAITLSEV